MENLHIRLKEELERLGISMAEAARLMGDENSQALRDICSARKRAGAEVMAKLAVANIGADVLYILTGTRSTPVESQLSPRAQALLVNYEATDDAGKKHIEAAASLLSQRQRAGIAKKA